MVELTEAPAPKAYPPDVEFFRAAEVAVTVVVDAVVTALVTVLVAVAELAVDDSAAVEPDIDVQELVVTIAAPLLLYWMA